MRATLPTVAVGDPLVGVSLQPYLPRAPVEGKLHAATLLWASLPRGSSGDQVAGRLAAVRASLGPDQVVWRVRHGDRSDPDGPATTWELYLWAQAARAPWDALARTLAAADLSLPSGLDPEPWTATAPWCISIDLELSSSGELRVSGLNLYLELVASTAVVHRLDARGPTVVGTQRRFEADDPAFDEAVAAAPHLRGAAPEVVVPPELGPLRWRYLTHKGHADGVYATGVDLCGFRWFLERHDFPAPMRAFVDTERRRLDHLGFDVGWDLRRGPEGIEAIAAAVYGPL